MRDAVFGNVDAGDLKAGNGFAKVVQQVDITSSPLYPGPKPLESMSKATRSIKIRVW